MSFVFPVFDDCFVCGFRGRTRWQGLTSITGSVVRYSMARTDVMHLTDGVRFIVRSYTKQKQSCDWNPGLLPPMDGTAEKSRNEVGKLTERFKSFGERLIDSKLHALSALGFLGPIPALDGATFEEEAHALQCIAGFYNATLTYYALDLCAALVSTLLGVGSLVWLPGSETVANSGHTRQRLSENSCRS